MELSKYKEQKNKKGGKIEPWLEFIIEPMGEEVCRMAKTNKALREAVEQFKLLNANEEVRRIAEMELRAEIIRNTELESSLKEGESRGLKRGRAEGKAIGRAEGEAIGRAEGSLNEKKKIAKKLLNQKIDIEIIKITTGLDDEELKKLA